MHSLIVTDGVQQGTHFELANRPLSVGRDPSRDIQITDPKVSRKHAMIRRTDAGHIIAPAKALNGVLINGEAVDVEALLVDGAIITLGDTQLRYVESLDTDRTNAVHARKNADRRARDAQTLM